MPALFESKREPTPGMTTNGTVAASMLLPLGSRADVKSSAPAPSSLHGEPAYFGPLQSMSMSDFQNTAPFSWQMGTFWAAPTSVLNFPFETWLQLWVSASSSAAVGRPPLPGSGGVVPPGSVVVPPPLVTVSK